MSYPKPLQDIVDEYKEREKFMKSNKNIDKDYIRTFDKDDEKDDDRKSDKKETVSPTSRSKERPFSDKNINHKW